ncbi:MAG: hypothetical protein P4L53_20945 [Candidatus Obscuribacterales bacterium]|nr:hypothetical protein [Candidatus Obscuribacterales bacterium]
MPFNAGELIFSWKHMLKGVDRRIKGQPRDHFLSELQAQGVPVKALLYQKIPQNCQLCGYALAELCMSEGWIMHACSAISFAKILNNQKHEDWLKALSASQLANGLTARSISTRTQKTSLPTAGV